MQPEISNNKHRADAIRNKQRVLNAAFFLFNTKGLSVSLEEIASEADTGIGTIYRHFPTKHILYAAVVEESLKSLIKMADQLISSENPGKAFFTFIELIVQNAPIKRSLVSALTNTGYDVTMELSVIAEEFDAKLGLLLAAAQKTGDVRKRITAIQVRAVIAGCLIASESYGTRVSIEELVSLVCDGLKNG